MVGERTKRAVRSDKKRDVKPTVPISLKDKIYRLAFITNSPVKNVAEDLVIYSLNSAEVRDNIAPYVRRDVRLGNTFLNGSTKREQLPINLREEETERLSMRLPQKVHNSVAAIAYGLDCTISKATATLLLEAIDDFDFINRYVKAYLENSLDDYHLREVEKIVKSVGEHESLASILGAIIEEIKRPVASAKEMIGEFLINNWRDNDY
ncbi:hypothetical protein ACWV26_17775 [Rummeliibacillus sp. JY-2-4R]